MIKSVKDTETKLIWTGDRSRKLPVDMQQRAQRRMKLLDAAQSLDELGELPGNRLHALKDDRAGQYSISINMQWRICFEWKDGDAYDVEITDYH
ncbi:type II toxin-antitoxin system RelE/ParE family toxin [Sphingomonas faeni]|uniref:type II toxin-antitoxin system RelE/ParE family toxin n=1 Tax=Sphingomonas faeni TaxID=185950 RepID=UPI0020C7C091|nr:type II toxin-antitoxin system RelE/ParE family toxin [Sphingomonas faeni]MCP8891754.1 type II toxin-antitoxin system RelE/ParE family toxin [Sphingomonas faeni]